MTLLLAETVPTTLTGALVAAISALGAAVAWLATRLLTAHTTHTAALVERERAHADALAAKDRTHADALARVHDERTEEVRALTEAATALREHTDALREHVTAHATNSRRSR